MGAESIGNPFHERGRGAHLQVLLRVLYAVDCNGARSRAARPCQRGG
jgi:hypothetical protein